jgi:GT2 family glycosyltransferase
VVATVGRDDELTDLLESLRAQTYDRFDVVIADQNTDNRLDPVLDAFPDLRVTRVRSRRGLSRARNAALAQVTGELVGFPDDDCTYPPDLLERLAARFVERPDLDGLSGRVADAAGVSPPRWSREPFAVRRAVVWHAACSATLFLRRTLVQSTGNFDERLGLGSGTAMTSGEEIDYLLRALAQGAQVEYDPERVVLHPARLPDRRELRALGMRDGASVGYLLRKHRFGPATVGRMFVRPAGGTVVALARRDPARAAFHAATLAGRLRGYLAAGT